MPVLEQSILEEEKDGVVSYDIQRHVEGGL
jgi:hypothetical protein